MEFDNLKQRIEQPFVVITGMHRSRTSMLAMMLAHSGIQFGGRVVGADLDNPHGYFEDQQLVDLHEEVLAANGCNWRPWRRRTFVVHDHFDERFRDIVNRRQASCNGVWGFKVPHATLLLPYWEQHENSRFVFIFRSPDMVLRSLYRRVGVQIYYKPHYILNCLRTYCIYNELILECYQQNRDRSYLVSSADLIASPSDVLNDLSVRLNLPVDGKLAKDLVDVSLVGNSANVYVEFLVHKFSARRDLQRCYAELDAVCDTRRLRRRIDRQAA
jgi:hypothetical protein